MLSTGGSTTTAYAPVNQSGTVWALEEHMYRSAVVTWVCYSFMAVLQAVVPSIEPDCVRGYMGVLFIVVAVVEAHHLCCEIGAWHRVKELLAPKERSVMRQKGVFRRRRFLVLLSILEGMDLYTDLAFPLLARACDDTLTPAFQKGWIDVPWVGQGVSDFLGEWRFWRVALGLVALNILVNCLVGLALMVRASMTRSDRYHHDSEQKSGRISGDVFVHWARSAETALMPSVVSLCETAGYDRRFVCSLTNTRQRMQLMQQKTLERGGPVDNSELETCDVQQEARVVKSLRFNHGYVLLGKVLLGNCLLLWLQSTYFAITYPQMASAARIEVAVSMFVTVLQAAVRMIQSQQRVVFCLPILCLIALSAANVVVTYFCNDHVWDLTPACLAL